MENLLYSFFVSEYQNKNITISLSRIKRFLSHIEFISGKKENLLKCLYALLNKGVIDYGGKNKFYLSPSIILNSSKYSVAINLIPELLEIHNESIISSDTGITIFSNNMNFVNDDNIKIIDYKFDDFIFCFKNIYNLFSSWLSVEFPKNNFKLEFFDPSIFTWKKIENPSSANSFYKVYYNSIFFEYYFFYKNKYYKLRLDEFEKINLVKTFLANTNELSFDKENEVFNVSNSFPLPVFIEKLLLLNHCSITGKFPQKRQYTINQKDFKKINSYIFKNHIKTLSYE